MGNFYTNITLRGTTRQAAAKALKSAQRSAYVSPERDGLVVVYDEACEEQDQQVLSDLCAELSETLGCAALGVINHDDDVLIYELWNAGEQTDEYNSAPDFASDLLTGDEDEPAGGDPDALVDAFETPDATADLERLLRNAREQPAAYLLHLALARLLGIPDEWVALGFNGIETGGVIQGLNPADMLRVG